MGLWLGLAAHGASRKQAHALALLAEAPPVGLLLHVVKGHEISGFGGGYSSSTRAQRLGAQWASLFMGVPSCPAGRQARHEEAQEPSWGTAQTVHFDQAAAPKKAPKINAKHRKPR